MFRSTVILHLFIVKPTLISTALNKNKISGEYSGRTTHHVCVHVHVCAVGRQQNNVPKTYVQYIQERWKTDIHVYDRSTRYAGDKEGPPS